MKYIQVNVFANAGEYHSSCKRRCIAFAKSNKYGDVIERLPGSGEVVKTVDLQTCGFPVWCYVFFVKA